MANRRALKVLATSACAALCALPSLSPAADETPFKLTLGWYRYSESPESSNAFDANLRHTSDLGNLWIGYFRWPEQSVHQWRGGWDRTFGEGVRLQPSLQVASGGFLGGSVGIEAGAPWFAGAGLGRTNLRPYYNLNFDPNDSWTLSAGHRGDDGQVIMLLMVRDNRENPDQRHVHLVWRQPIEGGQRLTLDALWKRGLVDGDRITRTGLSATWDWPRYFVRLAYDPKANFTSQDLWRLSVGSRF